MKHKIALFILLVSSYAGYSQEYSSKIEKHKEPSRSTFVSYRKLQHALDDQIDSSANYINLSGEWRMKYFDNQIIIPGNELETNTSIEKWNPITLPLSWELAGQGEAIFADAAYDFAKSKPTPGVMPDIIPAALFARDFIVPFDFTDRALYLHIGAAKAAMTVYVNGQQVGYSTDSRVAAEFNIAPYIVRGRNRVTLKVARWCEGSFLEDQQGWRLSGLNRDIYIFAQPKIRVRDYMVRTTLDPTYTHGLLETALLLKSELLNTHTVTVYYDLFDPQGKLVNQSSRDVTLGMRSEDTVRFTATVYNVKQWNDETPNLYTILYRVKREGRFTEYVSVKAGFRTIEIRDQKLLLNGKLLKIKGVNLAEHTLSKGNVLDEQSSLTMLRAMKLAGVNAIRTDGYPLPATVYRQCDRLGLYVVDVANINAQGLGTDLSRGKNLANDPAWVEQFLYRVNNSYQRSKAHPSVILWSLGDNAGNGYNMYKAYMMLKGMEQTRPVIYNGAGLEFNTEVYCPSLMPLDELRKVTADRPIIPSRVEFNSEYWQSPKFQGAFLDNWTSWSLEAPGVQYAGLSNDYKLQKLSNGTIAIPAQDDNQQMADFFAGVLIRQIDAKAGIYEFENRLQFTNLDQIPVQYTIFNAKKTIFQGILNITAAPGETVRITLPKSQGKNRLTLTVGDLAIANY